MKKLILLTLLYSQPVLAADQVDIRDYRSADLGVGDITSLDRNELLLAMEGSDFFHSSAKFSVDGATKSNYENTVYDVEILQKLPTNLVYKKLDIPGEGSSFYIRALIREGDNIFFRTLFVKKADFGFITVVDKDTPLSTIEFTGTVYLKERLLVLTGKTSQDPSETPIELVYPIGPGALDEGYKFHEDGKIRSLTPEYKGAKLERKWLQMSRERPSHFQGKPFVRITDPRGGYTALGFHIKQTKTLDRSFQSRGCIRMREKDLYELAMIVKYGKQESVSLDFTYDRLEEGPSYPWSRDDSHYYRPKNFGTKSSPQFRRDPEYGLLIVEKVKRHISLEELP